MPVCPVRPVLGQTQPEQAVHLCEEWAVGVGLQLADELLLSRLPLPAAEVDIPEPARADSLTQ